MSAMGMLRQLTVFATPPTAIARIIILTEGHSLSPHFHNRLLVWNWIEMPFRRCL